MRTLAERLEAAIRASGKPRKVVAKDAGIAPETLSRLISGENANPTYDVLVRVARAANTTVGALNGESIQLSAEDDTVLTHLRSWIDEKLATIDARNEPNALIIDGPPVMVRDLRIAERRSREAELPASPFGDDANLILRATGDSMRDAGILAGDTLYASTRRRNAALTALGKVVACRIGEDIFVKRLTSTRRRHFLLSANPRYRAIEIDPADPEFVILGIVAGRLGRII